jgi:hypothetical protein
LHFWTDFESIAHAVNTQTEGISINLHVPTQDHDVASSGDFLENLHCALVFELGPVTAQDFLRTQMRRNHGRCSSASPAACNLFSSKAAADLLTVSFCISSNTIAVDGRLSKPNKDTVCLTIHRRHELNLMRLFYQIFLVDTDCIYPQNAV